MNPEQNGSAVLLISLLNNSVNKSLWIAETFSRVYFHQFIWFLNHGMLDYLFFQDGIDRHSDMYYNVNRFDGHKQKLDRSLSFQTIDVAQCCTHVLQKLMTEAK